MALQALRPGGLLRRALRNHPPVDSRALLLAAARRRLMPWRPSVGWLLCGDIATGSSRIHGLNVSRELRRQGVDSVIVRSSARYTEGFDLDAHAQRHLLAARFDTVVFQRVHVGASGMVLSLQRAGTRCVFVMADLYDCELLPLVDHVVVVSDALREAVLARGVPAGRVSVIPDAVETPSSLCKNHAAPRPPGPLRLVWVGNEGHWHTLEPLRRLLARAEFSDMQLVTVSSHPEASLRWSLDSVWGHVLDADVAVIPAEADTPSGRVKSNNRVTMFRALGLPVVCSPLPAYRALAQEIGGIRLADDEAQWAEALRSLRDGDERRAAGLAARDRLFERYGLPAIAARFRQVLLPD